MRYSLDFYKEDLKDFNSARNFSTKGLVKLKENPTQKAIETFLTKLNDKMYDKANVEASELSRHFVNRQVVDLKIERLLNEQEYRLLNSEETSFLTFLKGLPKAEWYYAEVSGEVRLINLEDVETVVSTLNNHLDEMLWLSCYFGLSTEEYESIYKGQDVSEYKERYKHRMK